MSTNTSNSIATNDIADKVSDIANDDLVKVSWALSKIQAVTLGARCYFNSTNTERCEATNNLLYMFDIVEDIAKAADDSLLKTIHTLSCEMDV